jgi:nitrate/nitrite transporter NarK
MALVKSLWGSYFVGFLALAAVAVVCFVVLSSLEGRRREKGRPRTVLAAR